MIENDADLGFDDYWKPTSVEVLVMFPQWFFDWYDDSNTLTVHVYDSPNPTQSQPYSLTLSVVKSQLDWSPLTLPPDADWSGDDREQMAAWLQFDLSSTIPAQGFESQDYFVAVEWDYLGFPYVGYSNFELPCPQNWTDYGSGSWTQNTGSDCSWPMLKIEVETGYEGDCEE